MKKIISAILMLSIISIFVGCNSQTTKETEKKAVSTIEQIQTNGYINIGTTGEQFPFSFKDKDGNLQGIDIDLANKFAEELGIKAKFIQEDIDQLQTSLINKKIDIILSGFSITVKRNTNLLFTSPYFETGKAILSRIPEIKKGDKEFINRKEVTLVTIDKSSSLEFLKENFPNATVITKENVTECEEVLFSGEANGYIGDYELCENLFFSNKNNGDYNFRNLGTLDNHEFIGAAVSADDFHFFNLVDNFIKKIDRESQDIKIEESWLKYSN